MMSLPVTDPTLKRLLLEHLIEQLEAGGDSLVEAGMQPDLLERLRATPARDLIHIAQMQQLDIRAGFSDTTIASSLNRVQAIRQQTELRDYYILNGAPTSLICAYFRLPAATVRQLRASLQPAQPFPPSGRPSLPHPSRRDAIHEDWARIKRDNPDGSDRDLLVKLHRMHSDLTLHSLHATLHEHDEPASASN